MDSYYNQYINQYKIYTVMSADKLASFRVDSQLWEQFQSYAKENNVTATALLISYIKSVVNTGNVITPNPVVNTSSEIIDPSLSIQNIDKRIDDKIKLSIQNINTLSLQDIDNSIADSLADGGIGEAIAKNYEAMMGQFNGLLEELQELKKQFEELKSIPPVPVPQPQINEELTIDNEEPTTDNEQLTNEILIEPSKTDSDLESDTQSPMTNDQIPPGDDLTEIKSDNPPALPEKNQIDYVQKQLKKIGIKKSAGEIREAFINAGFDGNNYEVLRGELIESLSKE
ncbi:hypothetical protein [Aphanizomenon flos-aquae]|uniref:Uncharacterized protein n=1 Tax=Aphanizomenon flos-aquae FACHB-1040 TaxID=2692887 RepID=A0ABR8C327_APHFL|nr:hypothetical protein [Aphanizomenon flos-aquae]MBD2281326.1 hypothetical protein [Aphanizomenon flos-aquae FACHB-1040]